MSERNARKHVNRYRCGECRHCVVVCRLELDAPNASYWLRIVVVSCPGRRRDPSCMPHFFSVGGVNWTIAVNMSRLTENLENRIPVLYRPVEFMGICSHKRRG